MSKRNEMHSLVTVTGFHTHIIGNVRAMLAQTLLNRNLSSLQWCFLGIAACG